MRRLVRVSALVLAGLWSLLAWGVYALVGWFGDFAAANADWVTGHPNAASWLAWAAELFTTVGFVGVVAVWLVGTGVILAIPAALRLVGGPAGRRGGFGPRGGSSRSLPPSLDAVLRSRRVLRRLRGGAAR